MSDQHPNDEPRPTAASDDLPAEFSAIVEQLVRDGHAWQATLPDAERAAARMRAIPATVPQDDPSQADARSDRVVPRAATPRLDDPRPSMPGPVHGPGGRLLGGIAAVVVVALLIAVFAQISTSRGRAPSPATTTTPAATATPSGPPPGTLVHVAGLDTVGHPIIPGNPQQVYEAVNQPVIAPTDPNVAYIPGQYTITRVSHGVSWNLPLPAAPAHTRLDWFDLAVSPLNSDTIFASAFLVDDQGNQVSEPWPCTLLDKTSLVQPARSGGTVLASPMNVDMNGDGACEGQFVSTDGGQHWRLLHLPNGMLLGDEGGFSGPGHNSTPPAEVGSRLFDIAATSGGPVTPSSQLAMSQDGGQTWQLVSGPFTSAGRACNVAASADGRALYLLTDAAQGCSQFWSPHQTLWRSTDGGTSWTKVSLPTSDYIAAIASGGPQDALFAVAVHVPTKGLPETRGQDIYVSTDQGTTWTAAPNSGIAAGATEQVALLTGLPTAPTVLANGTVVLPFFEVSVGTRYQVKYSAPTLEAWQPGSASWQQVVALPSSLAFTVATTLSPVPGGRQVLSLVLADGFHAATIHNSVYQVWF